MSTNNKVFPVFLARDLDEAIAYYRDKLGFTIAWMWGEPTSRVGVALGDIESRLEGAGFGAPSPQHLPVRMISPMIPPWLGGWFSTRTSSWPLCGLSGALPLPSCGG